MTSTIDGEIFYLLIANVTEDWFLCELRRCKASWNMDNNPYTVIFLDTTTSIKLRHAILSHYAIPDETCCFGCCILIVRLKLPCRKLRWLNFRKFDWKRMRCAEVEVKFHPFLTSVRKNSGWIKERYLLYMKHLHYCITFTECFMESE